MITIIAEKPSVALEISRIVGARKREEGYMSGNGYAVTWAYGHLVEIWSEEGDDWSATLPVLPGTFSLRVAQSRGKDGDMRPDPGYARQLRVIKELFSKSDCIINAGDAGREGELIQRYIYEYVKSRVPVKRLWISSLTDEAISEGLEQLRPASEFDALYMAGKARNEADWLVGINATRAMTRAAGNQGVRSLGRVQTPTLALVCRRFIENRDFVSTPFWTVLVGCTGAGKRFIVRSDEKYRSYADACAVQEAVQHEGGLRVENVERKTVTQQPPLLYDLTALQRDANKRHSMSAQQTLTAAQSLYEHKLITYPRTGSRYITDDVYRTMPSLLGRLSRMDPRSPATVLSRTTLSRHSVSDAKVTDHHALLPTGNAPQDLQEDCRKVYELILTRTFEAFSGACEVLVTTMMFSAGGYGFSLKGSAVMEKGWRAVRNEVEPEKDEEGNDLSPVVPPLMQGERVVADSVEVAEGKTKPAALYTEATLLEAMEHAGREVKDESLKDALRQCGLGTPATRASEIETLLRRGYITRQSRQLIPTQLGLVIYDAVKDKAIADVEMTAQWESELSMIAEGKADVAEFDRRIREYTSRIVAELMADGDLGAAALSAQSIPGVKCPACGRALLLTTRLARCCSDSCGWKIWRTVSGKTLSEKDITSLVTSGRTMELKGFRSKTGKEFAARLVLEQEGKLSFEFVDHNKDAEGNDLLCPRCQHPVKVFPTVVRCSDEACGWKMWRTVAGKTITEPMLHELLRKGRTAVVKGFRSKAGKTFDASLCLNDSHEVGFDFPKKTNSIRKGYGK